MSHCHSCVGERAMMSSGCPRLLAESILPTRGELTGTWIRPNRIRSFSHLSRMHLLPTTGKCSSVRLARECRRDLTEAALFAAKPTVSVCGARAANASPTIACLGPCRARRRANGLYTDGISWDLSAGSLQRGPPHNSGLHPGGSKVASSFRPAAPRRRHVPWAGRSESLAQARRSHHLRIE